MEDNSYKIMDDNNNHNCFICNTKNKKVKNLVDLTSSKSKTRIIHKIADIIGNDFTIILSEEDAICISCEAIINKIEELEQELCQKQSELFNFISKKYQLSCSEETEFPTDSLTLEIKDQIRAEDTSFEPKQVVRQQFYCILCTFSSEDKQNFNKHSRSHIDSDFVCLQCLQAVNSYKELKEHINNHIMFSCRICKKPFPNYLKLKNHLLRCCNSSQGKIFKCSICKMEYFNYSVLRDHIVCKHRRKLYKRKKPTSTENVAKSDESKIEEERLLDQNDNGMKVDNSDEVEKHDELKNVSGKDFKLHYSCAICQFETPLDYEMKAHISSHTKDEYKCDRCNSVFKTAHTLDLHARRHQPDAQPTVCSICNCQCMDKLHLKLHKKNIHKVHLTCNVCKLTCKNKIQLQSHLEEHNGNEKFECEICNLKFSREVLFKSHQEYGHREDNKCKFCNKMLQNLRELRIHEKRHLPQTSMQLKCTHCEKILKTKTGLRIHLAKHTGEYKYFCEVCGRGCMSLVVLREHMGVHTKEERYVCDVCGKKFCFNATYRIHRMWHDNPKPYVCNECGQKFSHTSLLAVHRRKDHTGERPYVCTECNMSFTRSSSLKRHYRIHTGERPYTCIWCNKGFIEKNILAKHLASEHEDYSEINNKQKCEFKMVIRPEIEEPVETSIPVDNNPQSAPVIDEMQEFIIIGNPNMENMIFYELPSSQFIETKKDPMSTILIKQNDINFELQQDAKAVEVGNCYEIVQNGGLKEEETPEEEESILQGQHLLEGVDESNIIIKTNDGDMVIRNGQLVPLANIL